MSATELEKSSLLSEIEENLSNTITFKYKSVQVALHFIGNKIFD